MAATKLDFSEGVKLASEVSACNDQMDGLADKIDEQQAQLEFNEKEIARCINLGAINDNIDANIKKLRTQWSGMKKERDDRVKVLTDGGWTVPVPTRRPGAKGHTAL